MSGRCSLGGHDVYFDESNWRYKDNNELFDKNNERPCVKCNEYPTLDGDDACISNLGKVMNACCGHGNSKGYVQFDCGTTIRGYFEVEKDKPHPLGYEIRSREEIFKRIELESQIGNSTVVDILKWVMQMN